MDVTKNLVRSFLFTFKYDDGAFKPPSPTPQKNTNAETEKKKVNKPNDERKKETSPFSSPSHLPKSSSSYQNLVIPLLV